VTRPLGLIVIAAALSPGTRLHRSAHALRYNAPERWKCRDLVIFDPAAVRETNSFEKPKSYPAGIPYTIVNGVVVIDRGKHMGARPGRPLFGRGYVQR
jgi:hypothetical protein